MIADAELLFRDVQGGLSVLAVETQMVNVLMTNSTFVR